MGRHRVITRHLHCLHSPGFGRIGNRSCPTLRAKAQDKLFTKGGADLSRLGQGKGCVALRSGTGAKGIAEPTQHRALFCCHRNAGRHHRNGAADKGWRQA